MTDEQRGGEGAPQGWEPLPHSDYDDGATAFVQLPENIGQFDPYEQYGDSPLAAPGHGYVPPQITITPTAGGTTDPAATGSWALPSVPAEGQAVQWPEPGQAHDSGAHHTQQGQFVHEQSGTGQWAFEGEAHGGRPDQPDGPHAGEAQSGYADPHPQEQHPDVTDVTGEWSIPVAEGELPEDSGEFTTSSLASQWEGTLPPTLPGGAVAPWATGDGTQSWQQDGTAGGDHAYGEYPEPGAYPDPSGTEGALDPGAYADPGGYQGGFPGAAAEQGYESGAYPVAETYDETYGGADGYPGADTYGGGQAYEGAAEYPQHTESAEPGGYERPEEYAEPLEYTDYDQQPGLGGPAFEDSQGLTFRATDPGPGFAPAPEAPTGHEGFDATGQFPGATTPVWPGPADSYGDGVGAGPEAYAGDGGGVPVEGHPGQPGHDGYGGQEAQGGQVGHDTLGDHGTHGDHVNYPGYTGEEAVPEESGAAGAAPEYGIAGAGFAGGLAALRRSGGAAEEPVVAGQDELVSGQEPVNPGQDPALLGQVAQVPGPREGFAPEVSVPEAGADVTLTHATEAQTTGVDESGVAAPEVAVSEVQGSQELGSTEHESRDQVSQDHESQDPESLDHGSQDHVSPDRQSQDQQPEDPGTQAPVTEDLVTEAAQAEDTHAEAHGAQATRTEAPEAEAEPADAEAPGTTAEADGPAEAADAAAHLEGEPAADASSDAATDTDAGPEAPAEPAPAAPEAEADVAPRTDDGTGEDAQLPSPTAEEAPGHDEDPGHDAHPGHDEHPAPDADPASSETPDEEPDATPLPTPSEPAPTPVAPAVPREEHPLASYVLRVNGADRPVTGAWIGESLLYVLRERLGLAGAKDGCSQGECGACNVQVDGRLVASCLVPAATTAGSEVRTVEGLAEDGQPSDVQRALAACGAVQCGFCVPGMAMTVHDLLQRNPDPSELQTRQALCGNLCRCSGYRGVLDAVREVVAERGAEPRVPHQASPDGDGSAHIPAAREPYSDEHGGGTA